MKTDGVSQQGIGLGVRRPGVSLLICFVILGVRSREYVLCYLTVLLVPSSFLLNNNSVEYQNDETILIKLPCKLKCCTDFRLLMHLC